VACGWPGALRTKPEYQERAHSWVSIVIWSCAVDVDATGPVDPFSVSQANRPLCRRRRYAFTCWGLVWKSAISFRCAGYKGNVTNILSMGHASTFTRSVGFIVLSMSRRLLERLGQDHTLARGGNVHYRIGCHRRLPSVPERGHAPCRTLFLKVSGG
jgi:hypothetical protein